MWGEKRSKQNTFKNKRGQVCVCVCMCVCSAEKQKIGKSERGFPFLKKRLCREFVFFTCVYVSFFWLFCSCVGLIDCEIFWRPTDCIWHIVVRIWSHFFSDDFRPSFPRRTAADEFFWANNDCPVYRRCIPNPPESTEPRSFRSRGVQSCKCLPVFCTLAPLTALF